MSRLAKKPIAIPKGVEVKLNNRTVEVKGPKGKLEVRTSKGVAVKIEENSILIESGETLTHRPFLGLDASRLSNALQGVTDGYSKTLELVGVGYKAAVKGKNIELSLGFSHPCILPMPEGIDVKVESNTKVHVSGIDKALVGQFSATIRSKRPPEPYKGKGVKYAGEYIKRKAGKKTK